MELRLREKLIIFYSANSEYAEFSYKEITAKFYKDRPLRGEVSRVLRKLVKEGYLEPTPETKDGSTRMARFRAGPSILDNV